MNITKNNEFDYQAYTKENPPDSTKIERGTEARKRRFETAKKKTTIRIDRDILEQFQQLALQGQESERLINQALREWLFAKEMKELVREELHQIIQQVLSSAPLSMQLPKSKKEAV